MQCIKALLQADTKVRRGTFLSSHQCLREGSTMAEGTTADGGDARQAITGRYHHTQRDDQCLWQRALQPMKDLPGKGALADTPTYSTAIGVSDRSQQWQGPLLLIEKMQGQGFPADTITYSAAISACEKS